MLWNGDKLHFLGGRGMLLFVSSPTFWKAWNGDFLSDDDNDDDSENDHDDDYDDYYDNKNNQTQWRQRNEDNHNEDGHKKDKYKADNHI